MVSFFKDIIYITLFGIGLSVIALILTGILIPIYEEIFLTL